MANEPVKRRQRVKRDYLSDRLDASRECDAEILEALGWKRSKGWISGEWWTKGNKSFPSLGGKWPPKFTTDLLAAMSLYLDKPERIPSDPVKCCREALEQRGL